MNRRFLILLNYIRLQRGSINRKIRFLILGVIVIFIFIAFFWPVPTTFTVLAKTERVSGYTSLDKKGLPHEFMWHFDKISLCAGEKHPQRLDTIADKQNDCGDTPIELKDISGHLHIKSPFFFIMERKSNGPLSIALKPTEEHDKDMFNISFQKDGVSLRDSKNLPSPIFIEVSNPKGLAEMGSPITLPILGKQIVFGYETGFQNVIAQPMVLGGTVSVAGKTILDKRVYLAKEITLKYGDVISAPKALSSFAVLLRADERPAIQGIYRVEANQIQVRGFFSEAQTISLSFLNRLINDPLFSALLTLASIIFAITFTLPSGGDTELLQTNKDMNEKGTDQDLIQGDDIKSQAILQNPPTKNKPNENKQLTEESMSKKRNQEVEEENGNVQPD